MTNLSVNINKIATLRNARGGNNPDVVRMALDCERYGAQGITVHPRPDERHITRQDVFDLKPVLSTEFNIEGYPDERFMEIVKAVLPAQVTLVPDDPNQLTSNAGWDTIKNQSLLTEIVDELKPLGIRVSIFVAAERRMVEGAALTGAHRVELYTEPYAALYPQNPKLAVTPFIEAAKETEICNLGLNAGHDLSLENLKYFHQAIPTLDEVSIGHALVCDALYLGMEETVHRYLDCLK